ncbi:bifunctional 3'-5' exonuclease/DNA polymerase [Agromyces sp. MMS24-K17]|uniref:bifunctional 3'-5' exonuclease/DNA polymerase n=1 Tax=Agromyces sp. MMS24-K17 TaxID=3372850 RepID=UPI003754657E
MRIVISGAGPRRVCLVDPDRPEPTPREVDLDDLPAEVRRLEHERPRWVWVDTREWYPRLLAAGVRVERCHDLRLVGALLAHAESTAAARNTAGEEASRPSWLPLGPAEAATPLAVRPTAPAVTGPALFDFEEFADADASPPPSAPDRPDADRGPDADPAAAGAPAPSGADHGGTAGLDDVVAEHDRQERLIASSAAPAALRLLAAAESAGALIGAELAAAGLPWDASIHEAVLERILGPRPAPGFKPERMDELAVRVRSELGAPTVNLDSQVDLLRALRLAGIGVTSTSRWELAEHEHPAIEPLLAYKKLSRLLSANGWTWLEEWVRDGRFRPEYVPGGTATGRWATSGGGALQLPKQVRAAVAADPGWVLVVADAAQLEPRVLAAMSRDLRMADAARGRDVYAGIVEAGVVETRAQAKVAMLGAMYGATTGESGRLVPRLSRAFPTAMGLVDRAAAAGERGLRVSTFLGRSSPLPPAEWRAVQARAAEPDATRADESRARSSARDWGRFTRNFVVQGTAAEWALCWMAGLRVRLAAIGADAASGADDPVARASGPVFERMPHLVYYLHDEIIVHAPQALADAVADAVRESAAEAARMLFGDFPLDFPLDLAIVERYSDAGD